MIGRFLAFKTSVHLKPIIFRVCTNNARHSYAIADAKNQIISFISINNALEFLFLSQVMLSKFTRDVIFGLGSFFSAEKQ